MSNMTDKDHQIAQLRSQLPESMKHCKIVFEACELGHGSLRATNWVKHPCLYCEIKQLRHVLKTLHLGLTNPQMHASSYIEGTHFWEDRAQWIESIQTVLKDDSNDQVQRSSDGSSL